MSETTYTVEQLKVSDLEIDLRVQRGGFKEAKVRAMIKNYNADALGVIHVSRRADRGLYVIDGWHRMETVRRLTDNAGTITAHVYEGLSIAQEAEMFLALNAAVSPSLMDKFKVSLSAEDEAAQAARRVDKITKDRGWVVSPAPGNGNINAVGVLLRLDALSEKVGAEPHLIDATLLVITRSWGIDRHGAQAVILEGIGQLFAEHGSKIKVDLLIEKLREFKGGPSALHSQAAQMASLRNGRTANAVSDIVTETYNKGRKNNILPPWRRRT